MKVLFSCYFILSYLIFVVVGLVFHFLVVFMGSDKYPDENEYDTYIKSHGGSDNASTDYEKVNQLLKYA